MFIVVKDWSFIMDGVVGCLRVNSVVRRKKMFRFSGWREIKKIFKVKDVCI